MFRVIDVCVLLPSCTIWADEGDSQTKFDSNTVAAAAVNRQRPGRSVCRKQATIANNRHKNCSGCVAHLLSKCRISYI